MGSLNSILMKQKMAAGKVSMVVADTPVGIRIKYVGTGSVTTVTVDTDQDITLVSSEGGVATTEAYLFATYTTFGALADVINNSAYWRAEVLDALRADLTASSPFVDNATLTVTADGFYDALIDTSIKLAVTYRCTFDRQKLGRALRPKDAHRVHLQQAKYYADLTAVANGFRIYEWNPVNQTETQVYQALTVDNTLTTVSFASGEGELTSNWGNDLIVRVQTAAALADSLLLLETVYVVE